MQYILHSIDTVYDNNGLVKIVQVLEYGMNHEQCC